MLDQSANAIRNELAASYGVSASYAWNNAGGHYAMHGDIDAKRGAEALLLLQQRIASLSDGSELSKQTFLAARRQAVQDAQVDASSGAQLSSELLNASLRRMTPADISALPAQIAQLTYTQIAGPLTTELDPKHRVMLLTGSRAAVTAAYTGLGVTPRWIE
jgi:hypothetical protein